MKKAFLLVVLVAFSAVCLLSLVSCGEKTVYGETEYKSRVTITASENEFNTQLSEEEKTKVGLGKWLSLYFDMVKESAKTVISDVKDCKGEVVYTVDEKDVEKGVVVSKWLYLFSVKKTSENSNGMDYAVSGIKELWGKAEKENNCLQKYLADIGAYAIKNEKSEFFGKKISEIDEKVINDLGKVPQIVKDILESDPILQYGDGSLMMATLCYYGVLDFEKEAKGSGKLVVRNGKEDITLNVVGYYESEADKMLEKAVSMDKESKEYKTVLEQLQNPVFYSVCGNFLE